MRIHEWSRGVVVVQLYYLSFLCAPSVDKPSMPYNSFEIVIALDFYSLCKLVCSINITNSKFLTSNFDELQTLGNFRLWDSASDGLQTLIVFRLRLAT